MAFGLMVKNNNFFLIYEKINYKNYIEETYYTNDIYYFKDILKINNIQIIKDKILSHNAKYDEDNIYYFKNEQDAKELLDELNIILKLEGK